MEKEKLIFLGETIKKARKNKKLSQLDLSIEAGIDRKTISRLENGINEPSITSLYKLSQALNHDFIKEYMEINLEDYNIFHNTFEITIEKIENNINIDQEIQIFSKLCKETSINYIKNSCKQILLFLQTLDKNLKKEEIRKLLIKSLKVFDNKIQDLEENIYTNFELRILMNIAMTYINIDNEKYLSLLRFVYENTDKSTSLYPIICINLANAYIIIEKYEPCLEIVNNGISYYLDKKEIPNPILYFTRSVYKRLNNMEYKEDYEKSLLIASLAENYELVRLIKNTKQNYDKLIGPEVK